MVEIGQFNLFLSVIILQVLSGFWHMYFRLTFTSLVPVFDSHFSKEILFPLQGTCTQKSSYGC
jgi:hypothetical protein